MKEYGFHPLAEMFPAMSVAELAELAKDIEQNGQLHPIRVIGGQIIDGCNRYRACQIAGVEPVVEEYEGSTDEEILIRYVMSCNISRRQLTSSQRAMLAADLLPRLEAAAKERQRAAGGNHGNQYTKVAVVQRIEQAVSDQSDNQEQNALSAENVEANYEQTNPRSIEKAAEITGTNKQYVAFAKEIEEKSPGLAAIVKSGQKTIPAAIKEIRTEEKKQKESSERKPPKKDPPKLILTFPKKNSRLQELIALMDQIQDDQTLPEDIGIEFVKGKELAYEMRGAEA